MKNREKGFAALIIVVIVVIGLVLVGFLIFSNSGKKPVENKTSEGKPSESWSAPTKVINGYADADVVDLGNGKYRMYFGDVPGPNSAHGVFSAISTDGKKFELENGMRQSNAAFPDVIKLKDGTWRMYYQGQGGIQSSVSLDGLNWTQESGMRVDTSDNSALKVTEVGAPTTVQMTDGTFVMVYRGTIKDTYDSDAPNKGTNLLMWATSGDGVKFETKGIAGFRNKIMMDGWIFDFSWEDGIRLYYWTYAGVYYDSFDGKKFSGDNVAILAEGVDAMHKFAPNPPGDPTLIKIGNTWCMYYGSFDVEKNLQTLYYVTSQ
jgi:hypothetical protein